MMTNGPVPSTAALRVMPFVLKCCNEMEFVDIRASLILHLLNRNVARGPLITIIRKNVDT